MLRNLDAPEFKLSDMKWCSWGLHTEHIQSATIWVKRDGVAQRVWRLGYRLDDRGFTLGRGQEWDFFFLLGIASGLLPRPMQPPIQWVPGTLSPGVKLSRREADHSHLVPKSRMCGDTPPFPEYAFIAWYLVKKGEKSTGTTLSLPLSSEDGKIFSLTWKTEEFYTFKYSLTAQAEKFKFRVQI